LTTCLKILLPFLLSAQFLFAQNEEVQFGQTDVVEQGKYTIQNITVSDGLHSNNIYDVLQDSLGFLWLASGSGLQKYDGYTFTLHTPDSSDGASQAVYGLYEDRHHKFWLQMETGLGRYRRETDDFVRYYFVNGENDTIPYMVRSIAEDLKGALWVWIRDSGLYELNLETKNFIPQKKVNEWYRDSRKPVELKETNRKGFYETWITFQSRQYGMKLKYKFAIKRKTGTLEWEQNPNLADSESGDREIIIAGDTLNLPVTQFNSGMMLDREILPESDLKPTYVKFTVNLNNLKNPLSEGDEVQIRGDIAPLYWRDKLFVNCIVFDLDNKLWIGTDYLGLFRFNLETGKYDNFTSNQELSGSISSNYINAAIRDQYGDLWFGSNRGLNRFKHNGKKFENYFVDPSNLANLINVVHSLKIDRLGNIWTQSQWNNGGISCFSKKNKKFTHYSTGFGLWFSSFTLDRSGIVWLSNEFRGLHKLNLKAKKFSAFSIKRNGKDVLQGNPIYSVYEDQTGEIWIGGQLDGLYRYNRRKEKSTLYKVDSEQIDNLYSDIIGHIFQARNGIFWICTVGGLYRFDPKTGRFKRIEPDPDIDPGFGNLGYIYEDIHGMFWLLGFGFLVQFNPNTYEAQFFSVSGNPDLDRQIRFCDLIEDPGGFFWIAGGDNGGLYKFDLVQKKFTKIEKIGTVNIASIYLDDDGILWCGTVLQGLICYDTKTDTKAIIREKDGLLSNNIMSLEADQSGNLWLGTQKGLSRYNPQTGTFKHFFKEDGFFTDEFSYQAHAKGKNGELIFGTMHGVVTFHPDSIKDSDYIPPIVLTDFKINNKTVDIGNNSPLKKDISISKEIMLAHDQNDISITFAALDFSHPERNQYSLFLENFEDNWRPPGLERTAYYTNLDPGEYIFRAKGTNSDGVWNEEETSIKIRVLSPWWKTDWAYTLYVILIGLTLYGLRRFELKRAHLKSELEKSKEVDEMKSRFFANISHEFRTPLTLILGPLQKFLSVTRDTESHQDILGMQRNARRLQQLIDQLLDLSKIEAGRMPLQAQPDDIVQSIREWTASFVSLAESRNIALDLNFPEQPITVYFDPEKLEKIIYNLLGNAFKFTPEGGRVTVSVSLSNGKEQISPATVQITVADSGIGIAPEHVDHIFDRFYSTNESVTDKQSSTGIGLALTKEFVDLHHGAIDVKSEPGKGSTFIVTLPLGRDHLSDQEIVDHVSEKEILQPFQLAPEPISGNGPEIYEETREGKTGRSLVLIVEDNRDMRRFLRNCLAEDFNIIEADNGKLGFETARKKMPDLIVSDVMMPEMDGFEFCHKIKTDARTSHIPVILLTARASKESKVEGLETGADDYIVKPFDAVELIVRSKNLIEQRRRLQERFCREVLIQPSEVTVTSMDEAFLKKVITAVEAHIDDPDFEADDLARESAISRRHLNRKLRALTGQSVREFIRTIRLKRAAYLLQQNTGNVTEIAYEVGFQSIPHFAKVFREQFGLTPSQYLKKNSMSAK